MKYFITYTFTYNKTSRAIFVGRVHISLLQEIRRKVRSRKKAVAALGDSRRRIRENGALFPWADLSWEDNAPAGAAGTDYSISSWKIFTRPADRGQITFARSFSNSTRNLSSQSARPRSPDEKQRDRPAAAHRSFSSLAHPRAASQRIENGEKGKHGDGRATGKGWKDTETRLKTSTRFAAETEALILLLSGLMIIETDRDAYLYPGRGPPETIAFCSFNNDRRRKGRDNLWT